ERGNFSGATDCKRIGNLPDPTSKVLVQGSPPDPESVGPPPT
ncbi:hypothetical protein HMPREF0298_1866, partial [Corynebacterium lipophiloflavum DSM 44291]